MQDQQYQRDGWSAVMKNLDMVSTGFRRRVATFQELYTSFVDKKDEYSELSQLYLLTSLLRWSFCNVRSGNPTVRNTFNTFIGTKSRGSRFGSPFVVANPKIPFFVT